MCFLPDTLPFVQDPHSATELFAESVEKDTEAQGIHSRWSKFGSWSAEHNWQRGNSPPTDETIILSLLQTHESPRNRYNY
jgi:hypothetical protein